MTDTNIRPVIPANQPIQIRDLVPGARIFRWAVDRVYNMASELPCHPNQTASITYDTNNPHTMASRTVVCRQCSTSYSAILIPRGGDYPHPRISYRVNGSVVMSHPRRPTDGLG
jgi:hypothetical protein